MDDEAGVESVEPTIYNFHGIFSVAVAHRALNALMREEFGMFIDEVDAVDLTVMEGTVPAPDRMLSLNFAFDDSSFVVVSPSGRIQVGKGWLRGETGIANELLRWVVTVMRQHIIQRGTSLVHASAVARDGIGFVFPAWAHTGKTNVVLGFLKQGYDYMADDWCFVSASGESLAFPRHLSLFDYNFDCHPFLQRALEGSVEGRMVAPRLAANHFAQSLRGSNPISRRLRRWLLSRYYLNVKVPVSRVVPGCPTALRAQLSKVCLLTTARSESGVVTEVSASELASKSVLSGHYERHRFHQYALALAYAGLQAFDDNLVVREREVLTKAYEQARCLEVTLPQSMDSAEIDRIRTKLEDA